MERYDKLVRDKIPEIIEDDGKEYKMEVMDDEEYKEYLKDKLLEETEEYLRSGEVDELADVFEVVKTIAEDEGLGIADLEEMRKEKAKERGRFKKKIKLIEVRERV